MKRHYSLYPVIFYALCALGCDDDVENPPYRPDGGPIPTQTVIHKVVVAHHPMMGISKETIIARLNEASTRLTNAHDAADVQCCVQLPLAEVRTNRRLPISVRRHEDLVDIRSVEPSAFTVVQGFSYCGPWLPSDGTIRGCTQERGELPAVVSADYDDIPTNGAVWAHEFGHAQGLPHRAGCPIEAGAQPIMGNGCDPAIIQRVSADECTSFRTLRPENNGEDDRIASGVTENTCPP